MDQLAAVRREQHRRWMLKNRLPELRYNISRLIAAVRIQRWLRRKYLPDLVNDDDRRFIPSIYRMRVKFTDANKVKDNNQNQIMNEDERALQLAISESLGCDNIDIAIAMSMEKTKDEETNGFYYLIDLRKFGIDPIGPIEIFGDTYYLNKQQCSRAQKLWNRVNSVKFEQDMEYQKGLNLDKKEG